jgi:hypothetical protein
VDVLQVVLLEILLDPVLRVDVALRADIASPEGFSGIAVLVGDRRELTIAFMCLPSRSAYFASPAASGT